MASRSWKVGVVWVLATAPITLLAQTVGSNLEITDTASRPLSLPLCAALPVSQASFTMTGSTSCTCL